MISMNIMNINNQIKSLLSHINIYSLKREKAFEIVRDSIRDDMGKISRFGAVRTYRLAFEYFQNEPITDCYMLSEFEGYTRSDIKQIKYQMNRRIKVFSENVTSQHQINQILKIVGWD